MTLCEQLFQELKKNPATTHELTLRLGKPCTSVGAKLSEMRDANWVVEAGKAHVAGRTRSVWKLTSFGEDYLAKGMPKAVHVSPRVFNRPGSATTLRQTTLALVNQQITVRPRFEAKLEQLGKQCKRHRERFGVYGCERCILEAVYSQRERQRGDRLC